MKDLLINFDLIFILIVIIFSIAFYCKQIQYKNHFVVTVAVLDGVIDNYYDGILVHKIKELENSHNLQKESKLNAIESFRKKRTELVGKSTVEIIKFLSPHTRRVLKKHFSDRSLVLLISNRLNQHF